MNRIIFLQKRKSNVEFRADIHSLWPLYYWNITH